MLWTPETSLNLTWFRAYDPAVGRWLSRDPFKDAETSQGINLFAYVRNNSVNLTDPLGLEGPGDLSWGQMAQLVVCHYTGLFCPKPDTSPDRGWIGGDPRPSGGGPDGGAGPNGGAPGGAAPAGGMPGGGGGGAHIGPGGLPGGLGQCGNDNNTKPPRPPCTLDRGLMDMTTGLFSCEYACTDGKFTLPYKMRSACPPTRPREYFP
jgi:RHS repeat-associated protein